MPNDINIKRCNLITFINPLSVFLSSFKPDFLANLDKFDAVYADGILLARAASYFTGIQVPRISFDGNSIAEDVFRYCAKEKLSLALIGGKDDVAENASRLFSQHFEINISYFRHGYFSSANEMQNCVQAICKSDAAVVICGMGAPHQEHFLLELKKSGWIGTGFSCGGYLDQAIQSDIKYYPEWVNRLHLRALYRLCREPRRLGRRYFIEYQLFFLAFLELTLRNWKNRNARI